MRVRWILTKMNKNLVDYTENWAEVEPEPEPFDSVQDASDWTIYHLTELHRLVRHHIHHQIRSKAFISYFGRNKMTIQGEFFNYVRSLPQNEATRNESESIYLSIGEYIRLMMEDVTRLNRIPVSD